MVQDEPDFEAVAAYLGDERVAVVKHPADDGTMAIHGTIAPDVTPLPRCGPGGHAGADSFELLTVDEARDRAADLGLSLRACVRCWGNYRHASGDTPAFPTRGSARRSTGVSDD